MKVFDFAIKMELDGRELYGKLARETGHAGLKNIFSQLAADEQKHYEIFMALRDRTSTEAMKDTAVLEEAKNLFGDLLKRQEPLGRVEGDVEAYRRAMKLEADSFRLYEEAAERETDAGVRELLLRVAREEHKHYEILRNLHDFANAPNEYLAWREFSNLDEFRQFGREVD